MAKNIDLTSKLNKEKPTITIGDLTIKVNDEKSNVLAMNSLIKKSEGLTELEMMDLALEKLIGAKSMKEIEKLKLRLSDYKTIYTAIMAVVNDQSFEEAEENFRKAGQ